MKIRLERTIGIIIFFILCGSFLLPILSQPGKLIIENLHASSREGPKHYVDSNGTYGLVAPESSIPVVLDGNVTLEEWKDANYDVVGDYSIEALNISVKVGGNKLYVGVQVLVDDDANDTDYCEIAFDADHDAGPIEGSDLKLKLYYNRSRETFNGTGSSWQSGGPHSDWNGNTSDNPVTYEFEILLAHVWSAPINEGSIAGFSVHMFVTELESKSEAYGYWPDQYVIGMGQNPMPDPINETSMFGDLFFVKPRLIINEVSSFGSGNDEWIEIYNGGSNISLYGFNITDQDGNYAQLYHTQDFPFGSYLILKSGTGTDDPDLSDGRGTIYLEDGLYHWDIDSLDDSSDDILIIYSGNECNIDFMNYTAGMMYPDSLPEETKSGTSWSIAEGGWLPAPSHVNVSLARMPNGVDADDSQDWVLTSLITEGEMNSLGKPSPGYGIVAQDSQIIPTINGAMGSGEWSDAKFDVVNDSGLNYYTIYVKINGLYLYVSVELEPSYDKKMENGDLCALLFDTNHTAGVAPQPDDWYIEVSYDGSIVNNVTSKGNGLGWVEQSWPSDWEADMDNSSMPKRQVYEFKINASAVFMEEEEGNLIGFGVYLHDVSSGDDAYWPDSINPSDDHENIPSSWGHLIYKRPMFLINRLSPYGSEKDEIVELFNNQSFNIDIHNVTIGDQDGNEALLPTLIIPPRKRLVVRSGNGTNDFDFTDGYGVYYTEGNDYWTDDGDDVILRYRENGCTFDYMNYSIGPDVDTHPLDTTSNSIWIQNTPPLPAPSELEYLVREPDGMDTNRSSDWQIRMYMPIKTFFLHDDGAYDITDNWDIANTTLPMNPTDLKYENLPSDGVVIGPSDGPPDEEYQQWNITPSFAGDFHIFGEVKVVVWTKAQGFVPKPINLTASLYDEDGSMIRSTTTSLNNWPTTWTKTFLSFPFINYTIPYNGYIYLNINRTDNESTEILVMFDTDSNASFIEIPTDTYVKVDWTKYYDAATDDERFPPIYSMGEDVRIRANLTDPIGSYDIRYPREDWTTSGANITMWTPSDPINPKIDMEPMIWEATDLGLPSAWKRFVSNIPNSMLYEVGSYTATITAWESNGMSVNYTTTFEILDPPPHIEVWEPGGVAGQVYTQGDMVAVLWDASDNNPWPNSSNVVNISYGNPGLWTTIVSNEFEDGSYIWNTSGVACPVLYYMNISVYDNMGQKAWGYSNASFKIECDPPPDIGVWEPGGTPGQTYYVEDLIDVLWRARDNNPLPATPINITYGSPGSWNTLSTLEPDDGIYSWDTTGVTPGTYWMNLSVYDNLGQTTFGESNFSFEITLPSDPFPTIEVFEPGGTADQIYFVRDIIDVLWLASDNNPLPATPINITYGNPGSWNTLSTLEPNDGIYSWDTASVIPGTYWMNISVYDSMGQTTFDKGNFTFEILFDFPPFIEVYEPGETSGQIYTQGDIVTVTWTAGDEESPLPDNPINITYGVAPIWTAIATKEANDGSYSWDTSGVPCPGTYWMNLSAYDSAGQTTFDEGNFNFTINCPPSIEVWEPGGIAGKKYVKGDTITVTWIAEDDSPLPATPINITYGTPGSWTTIATLEANDGTYSWDTTSVSPGTYWMNISVYDSNGVTTFDESNYSFNIRKAPYHVMILSGNHQNSTAGTPLPAPLIVKVKDQFNDPVSAGEKVWFNITTTGLNGDGFLSTSNPVFTDVNGHAETTLTLDTMAGNNTVTAEINGAGQSQATFSAIGTLPLISPSLAANITHVLEGKTYSYIITYDNVGTESANNVYINDTLPSTIVYISDTSGTTPDISGSTYSWFFSSVPPGSHFFIMICSVIMGTPDGTIISNQFTVDYSDQSGKGKPPAASNTVDVAVISQPTANIPPTIEGVPDLVVHYDWYYGFDLSPYITDPDNQPSELFLILSDTLHARVNPANNLAIILNYSIDYLNTTQVLNITVSDGFGSDWDVINVSVTDNFPPEMLNNIPNVVMDEDTVTYPFNISHYFFDRDGDDLYYTAGQVNTNITFLSNHTVCITPFLNWFGLERVTFRAIDPTGALVENTINITVRPINDAPEVSAIPDQNGDINVAWSIYLESYILDVDNQLTEIIITTDSPHVIVNGLYLTFRYSEEIGTDIVTITVSDGEAQAYRQIRVTVLSPSWWDALLPWIIPLLTSALLFLAMMTVYRRRTMIVQDALLIYMDGALLAHATSRIVPDLDTEIFSSMLTAIQDFVKDSFKDESDWGLKKIAFRDKTIYMERGKSELVSLALIYKGEGKEKKVAKIADEILEDVEKEYGDVLKDWDGTMDSIRGVKDVMKKHLSKG